MNETSKQRTFWRELRRELGELWQALSDAWAAAGINFRNQIRRWRRARLDYIVITLSGPLPERAAPPRGFLERRLPLPAPPLSLEQLNDRLQAVADAANVKGVLFVLRGVTADLATLQNVRRSIGRLRAAGKEAVVFTAELDLAHYYVASAADRIVAPPSAQFNLLGLRTEVVFLKDTLAKIGVGADVVQISPYKTAFNSLAQSDLTPEHRAQLEWLLDDEYDMLTADMAADRHLTPAALQALIDQAPHFPADALRRGLIDHVAYEDQLAELLAAPVAGGESAADEPGAAANAAAARPAETTAVSESAPPPKARLAVWNEAYALLLEKPRRRSRRFIGVISLEGLITMGPSRQPPLDLPLLGTVTAGEQTLARLLRKVETLDNMAALILHVDSGGGSALASDLIAREIERLNHKKPVLAYMGNRAASGGYYVSAPARHIMSQRGTITGSIGVIMLRLHTRELYGRLGVNRVTLQKGERAGLYSDAQPLTEAERALLWDGIVENYERFKAFVARGRGLPAEALDPICEGRVWTGQQALEHKLVDSHGDFVEAVRQAAELAGLPTDDAHEVSVVNIFPRSNAYTLPQAFELPQEINRWLSAEWLNEFIGRTLWLLPYTIKFK